MAISKIVTASITDNAVTAAKVPVDGLAATDIAANAITASELADDAVDTAAIADDAVTNAKIGADAVSTTEIANDASISTSGNIATTGSGTLAVAGTSTLTGNATAAGNLTVTGDIVPSTPLSHRNMIINGDMQVWQRATSTTTITDGYFTADRWYGYESTAGSFTSGMNTLSLADKGITGHSYAFSLACSGADTSIAAGDHAYVSQKIEAQNLQHLKYGTASAEDLVLSFWVRSYQTGTFCIGIEKPDTTSYKLPIEYTINASNTWEYKTINISPTAGSTSLITGAGGVINSDTGEGLNVMFWLVAGSTFQGTNNTWATGSGYTTSNQTNFFSSTSNTFMITGVQLELGSNATPFEHRSYGDVLKQCQRYFVFWHAGSYPMGTGNGTYMVALSIMMPEPMRATPTLTTSSGDSWSWRTYHTSEGYATSTGTPANLALNYEQFFYFTVSGFSGLTDNSMQMLRFFTSNPHISAEL